MSYTLTTTRQPLTKTGSRTQWFVTVTSDTWQDHVRQIGSAFIVEPSDSPETLQQKRETLAHTLLAQAETEQLPIDGLASTLTETLTSAGR